MSEQQFVNSIRNDKSQMEVVNFMLNNVKMLRVNDSNVEFKDNGDIHDKRYILVENKDGTNDLIVYSNEGIPNKTLRNDAFIIKNVKNFKAIEKGKYFECEKDGFIIKNSKDASFRSLSIFKKGNEREKLAFGDHGLQFNKFNNKWIRYENDCDLSINSLNKIYNFFNGGSIEYQGNDAEFLKNKLYEGLGVSQDVNSRKQQQNMLSPMNMMMNNQMFNNMPMVLGIQNMSQQQNFISNGFNNNNFNNGNMNMFNNNLHNFNNLNNMNNNGGMISFGNNQNNMNHMMNVNNQQIINNNFNNNFNSNQMMPRSNNMIVNNQMVNNNMMNQINNNVNNNILFNRVQTFNNNQNQFNILNQVVNNNIQMQTVNCMCELLDGFYNFALQAQKGGIDIYREMNKRKNDMEDNTGSDNVIFAISGYHNFGGNGIAGLGFQHYSIIGGTSSYIFNCCDLKHGNYEIKISFSPSDINGNMYLTIGDKMCSVNIYDTSYDTVSLLSKMSLLFKMYDKNIIEKNCGDLKRLIDRIEYLDNQKKIYENMKGIFFNGLIPSQKDNNRKIDNNWVFRLGQKNPLGNRKLCLNNNGTIDNSKYIQIYNCMPVLSQIKYCVQNFKKFYMMNTSRDKINGYDVNSQIINALTQLYDFYYSSKSTEQKKQMAINSVATILDVNSSYLSTMLSNIYNIFSSQQDKSLGAVAELIGNVCIDLSNDNNRDIWNGVNIYQQSQNNCVNNNINNNKPQIQNYQNQTTNNNNINLNNNQINNINNNNVNNIVNNFNDNNFIANNNNFNNNNLNYPNVQNQQKYNNNQNNFDRWKDNAIQQLNKEFNNKPNDILLKTDNKKRVTEIKKKVNDGFIIFRPSQDEVFTEKEIDEIMKVDSSDKMDKLVGIKSFFLSTNNKKQSRFCWNTNKNKVEIDMADNINDYSEEDINDYSEEDINDYRELATMYITFKKEDAADKKIYFDLNKYEYSLDDFFNILEKKEIKQGFCDKYEWLKICYNLFDDLCNDFNKFKTIKNKENLENINQFIFDIDKIGTKKFLNLKGMID